MLCFVVREDHGYGDLWMEKWFMVLTDIHEFAALLIWLRAVFASLGIDFAALGGIMRDTRYLCLWLMEGLVYWNRI